MKKLIQPAIIATLSVVLAACAGMNGTTAAPDVPAAVAVPSGNKPAMTLVGAGLLTYECKAKAGADTFEWAFAGPDAKLSDKGGAVVGKYYGGPTWEHSDGSKVTGKQLAVSPSSAGNIPMQLVQANPATGSGGIQRRKLYSAPEYEGRRGASRPVHRIDIGREEDRNYSADYVFYKK